LAHDWLYATHRTPDGRPINRTVADDVLERVLTYERMTLPARFLRWFSRADPFGWFAKAWKTSGARGPRFLRDVCETVI